MSIVFLDQPIGTGFSYIQDISDAPLNMNDIAKQAWTGIVNMHTDPNGCFYGLNLNSVPTFIAG